MTVNHGVLGSSPCSGAFWEFSSAGSEHLPYKQRVGGSNPSTPTERREIGYPISFFCLLLNQEQALVKQYPKKYLPSQTLLYLKLVELELIGGCGNKIYVLFQRYSRFGFAVRIRQLPLQTKKATQIEWRFCLCWSFFSLLSK